MLHGILFYSTCINLSLVKIHCLCAAYTYVYIYIYRGSGSCWLAPRPPCGKCWPMDALARLGWFYTCIYIRVRTIRPGEGGNEAGVLEYICWNCRVVLVGLRSSLVYTYNTTLVLINSDRTTAITLSPGPFPSTNTIPTPSTLSTCSLRHLPSARSGGSGAVTVTNYYLVQYHMMTDLPHEQPVDIRKAMQNTR